MEEIQKERAEIKASLQKLMRAYYGGAGILLAVELLLRLFGK